MLTGTWCSNKTLRKFRIPIKSRRYGFKGTTLGGENTNSSLEVEYHQGWTRYGHICNNNYGWSFLWSNLASRNLSDYFIPMVQENWHLILDNKMSRQNLSFCIHLSKIKYVIINKWWLCTGWIIQRWGHFLQF